MILCEHSWKLPHQFGISMDFLPFPNWQRRDVCRWSRLPNASNLHFLPEGIHRRRTVKVWKENQSIPNLSTCNRINCGFLWHLDLCMSGWCRWILCRRERRRHGGRNRAHDRRHLPKAAEAKAYSKPKSRFSSAVPSGWFKIAKGIFRVQSH